MGIASSIGAALLLVFASAGTASRAQPVPLTDFDACTLFTKEEVVALAKEAWRRKPSPSYMAGSVKVYSCWHGTQFDGWAIKILVEQGRTPAETKMMIDTLNKVAKQTTGTPLVPVAGLGDAAYWGQIGPTNGQLQVILGTDMVTVQTWGKAPGAGTLAKTKELTTLIVQRFKTVRR